ncbi:MAG: hypothetical protein JSS19_04620 [Proteobacteria bacterium]|nr:hypothetical protein [Pseudomonadota bacterium]MBS0492558.1 hypothetical protein [Pseudomonadota bacterium]MBS0608622.1 hypothetical protein [Pseudomonadota bacterium]
MKKTPFQGKSVLFCLDLLRRAIVSGNLAASAACNGRAGIVISSRAL